MRQCGLAAADNRVGIGAIVLLQVDYCTHCHAQGLLAIVYDFHTDTGGVLVVCEHGIITHDGSCNNCWVPYDKYKVVASKDNTFPLHTNLQSVRDIVLAGNFKANYITNRISFSKYVEVDLGAASPVKKCRGCSCKSGCKKGCGCKKKGVRCHSGCACNDNYGS